MPDNHLTIETRFGTFDLGESDVITFPRGLLGFEGCRRFVLLSHETFAPLRCVHAIDGPDASFLAVDPRTIVPDYRCSLQPEERAQVGAESDTPLLWLVLVAMGGEKGVPTANLRAPIVINPASMLGSQFVIDDDRYPVRHKLAA